MHFHYCADEKMLCDEPSRSVLQLVKGRDGNGKRDMRFLRCGVVAVAKIGTTPASVPRKRKIRGSVGLLRTVHIKL